MATRSKKAGDSRLIKKYPNRRLYDTQTSAYVTLVDIKNLVMAGDAFSVVDAKTEDDLTRNILLQIILEEEAGGAPVFSSQMLSQIIRFYGNSMQGLMGSYLEKTMQSFVDIHNKLGDQTQLAHAACQQTRDVVAGYVFHHLTAKSELLAFAVDHLGAQDEITHIAYIGARWSAQSCGDHSAHCCTFAKMWRLKR